MVNECELVAVGTEKMKDWWSADESAAISFSYT
jgi:hypothetical protein